MSSLPNHMPVIVCGRSTVIGKPIAEALLPEFEVIHFIMTNEAAQAEIPHVLAGRDPQSPDNNDVGSGNYSKPARAVVFGRGYAQADVEAIRVACEGVNREPVLWVVGDDAKAPAPGAPPPGEGYAKMAAQGTKNILTKWKDDGADKDEVVIY
ncbi:hypothetical protein N7466_007834 [Penicillium verhagenii]|uniref:uncharacterized protein n=1 Tax=Penicillium verhagenii TaxID=1562060 RepID=UPI0025458499|nr:uncharacterized protein N7466_007834 [Penicillium verhagenii]KAJ5928878.1 hypothetical protein N7466_007834 [Penicillium verhagenii]